MTDGTSPHSPEREAEQTAANISTGAGLACNSCRKAKLKCSRDKPTCQYCRKVGTDCVYETKRIKPGLKIGAIDHVHKRLDDLERRIQEQDSRYDDLHRNTSSSDDPVRGREDLIGESPVSKILSVLATELPRLADASKTASSAPHPARKRRHVDDDDALHSPLSVHSDFHAPGLPPMALLEPVIAAYFEHVHPWIPMIHQGRFRQRLESPVERDKLDIVLRAMIIAAAKFVDNEAIGLEHGSLRSTQTDNFKKWVVSTAMETLSLESLQALIIVAFNDIGCGNGHKVWSIIGSLSRTIEYMQLSIEYEETVSSPHQPLRSPATSLCPSQSWTEVEERRRVFWNVFNLDRFCSTSMGWNTSLTSDDVYRRLPCDGRLWRQEEEVRTPYLGIWNKSAGRIGNPINVGPSSYPSPSAGSAHVEDADAGKGSDASKVTDMSRVGAFAYCIEATESMSRVSSYFLHQKINFNDPAEVSSWLTRFKELDLRLVHWKMLLPSKWKSHMAKQTTTMDPNLTLAHVTHNASTIMLHQPVAYPKASWTFRRRLPSSWSAETCCSAAVEIATIARNYLRHTLVPLPVASQFAFCLLIAARMLLVHWRFDAGNVLLEEFWSLVSSLEDIGRRWAGSNTTGLSLDNLASKYAIALRALQQRCLSDGTYSIDVKDYCSYDIPVEHETRCLDDTRLSMQQQSQIVPAATDYQLPSLPTFAMEGQAGHSGNQVGPSVMLDGAVHGGGVGSISMEFTTTPPMLLDSTFMEMDRVISFDDGSMFTNAFDATGW